MRTIAKSTARRRGRLQPLAALALIAGLCAPPTAQAGELRFSGGWLDTPDSVQINRKVASKIVLQCPKVGNVVEHRPKGVATVIAAPHKSGDGKMHLTVDVKDPKSGDEMCHVYTKGNLKPVKSSYRDCNCVPR